MARYEYDPWGTRTKTAGGGVDADFGFTGHLLHSASGLALAKYRAYSATLGRWISADPIGEEDDLNLYRYVGGSPTLDWDPLGLRSWLREALGFVPVVGSALDAYDAARCGDYLMAGVNGVMAISEALGVGLVGKIVGKGAKLLWKGFRGAKKIHKNSSKYAGETHVHRNKGPDGKTFKIGESAQGVRKSDGLSIRAEAQVRRFQRATGQRYESEIRKTFGNKAEARAYERRLIARFRRLYGNNSLTGNKSYH